MNNTTLSSMGYPPAPTDLQKAMVKARQDIELPPNLGPGRIPAPSEVAPPPPTTPTFKQHDWGGAPRGYSPNAHLHSPGWLQETIGGKTCSVCGVEVTTVIRPDREGMGFQYKDAYGNQLISLIELECPTFIGDPNGAIGEAKQRIRKVTGRVDSVEGRVESVEDRLDRLESENLELRAKVEAKTELDVTELVNWLATMVKEHVDQNRPTIAVSVANRRYALPEPVANMIIDVAAMEPEKVPARTRKAKKEKRT